MLFGGVTYESLEGCRYEKAHGQYFWWASIRLDTRQVDAPVNTTPCKEAEDTCSSWEPHVIEDPWLANEGADIVGFPDIPRGNTACSCSWASPSQRDLELHGSDAVVDRRLVSRGRLADGSLEIDIGDHALPNVEAAGLRPAGRTNASVPTYSVSALSALTPSSPSANPSTLRPSAADRAVEMPDDK
jgi:hypothetical protein